MSNGFGVPPCKCTPGENVDGHQTWVVSPKCPVHGLPDEVYPGKKKQEKA